MITVLYDKMRIYIVVILLNIFGYLKAQDGTCNFDISGEVIDTCSYVIDAKG